MISPVPVGEFLRPPPHSVVSRFVAAQILVLMLHETEVEGVTIMIEENTDWLDNAFIVYFFMPYFGDERKMYGADLPTKTLLNAVGDLCQTRYLVSGYFCRCLVPSLAGINVENVEAQAQALVRLDFVAGRYSLKAHTMSTTGRPPLARTGRCLLCNPRQFLHAPIVESDVCVGAD